MVKLRMAHPERTCSPPHIAPHDQTITRCSCGGEEEMSSAN